METPSPDPEEIVEVVRHFTSDPELKNTKTLSDLVYTKSIYINGHKLSGVQSVNIDYDISRPITLVTISMAVKRDSLKIESDKISFDEVLSRD